MLRYVEAGAVNAYAVTYPVLVAANVSSLNFLWQSHAQSSIAYELRVDVEEGAASGLRLSLNVPNTGYIPTFLSRTPFPSPSPSPSAA